ncbi:hypothetical protein [Corynebacterium sp. CCM 9204]|uniref:hypothetical protein n=1 Tax=Corynebacterium sp. CCM 9204 TaxID=3057616 RepID=UPI00352356A5
MAETDRYVAPGPTNQPAPAPTPEPEAESVAKVAPPAAPGMPTAFAEAMANMTAHVSNRLATSSTEVADTEKQLHRNASDRQTGREL